MCLALDGKDYCLVLRHARGHWGSSLEGYQHGIEENRRDVMDVLTPELERTIARVCGLSLSEYRAMTVRVRSENARREILESNIPFGFGGENFLFPRAYADFVCGVTDKVIRLPLIDDETWEYVSTFMRLYRDAFASIKREYNALPDSETQTLCSMRGSFMRRARDTAMAAL